MRSIFAVVALLFWLAGGAKASPALNQHGNGMASNVGVSYTLSISASSGDVVLLHLGAEKAQSGDPYPTLTPSGCVTWTQRALKQYFAISGANSYPNVLYEWSGTAATSLTSCAVTITVGNLGGHNIDDTASVWSTWSGTVGSGFDSNVGLPFLNYGANASVPSSPTVTFSTSLAADAVVIACETFNNGCNDATVCPGGFSGVDTATNLGGSFGVGVNVCYKTYSTQQSGVGATYGVSVGNWSTNADALTTSSGIAIQPFFHMQPR